MKKKQSLVKVSSEFLVSKINDKKIGSSGKAYYSIALFIKSLEKALETPTSELLKNTNIQENINDIAKLETYDLMFTKIIKKRKVNDRT